MAKKIPFKEAQFVCAAYGNHQFPYLLNLSGKPMPEIAIVGRSNVGKSSLINHLLNNRSLAKTSAIPGKTQSINFFTIDQEVALVDLPGYGYAKVSKEIRKEWGAVIDQYLKQRLNLALLLFLIDSRRTPSSEDCALIEWASFHKKPLLIVFTKSDKLKEQEIKNSTLSSLERLHNYLHSSPVQFLHYSIKSPTDRMELIEKINTLLSYHGSSS